MGPPHAVKCIYCNNSLAVTEDHVPPECLFPKGRRKNLIVVPACIECNRGRSKDDEYLRLNFAMAELGNSNSAALWARETALRGLAKPQAIGFRRQTVANLVRIPRISPTGVFGGTALGAKVDLDRLRRALGQIVRGLFYHERGFRVPDNHVVEITFNEDINQMPAVDRNDLQANLLIPLASKLPVVIDEDVFFYRYAVPDENSCVMVWGLTFYRSTNVLCTVLPKDWHVQGRLLLEQDKRQKPCIL